MFSDIMETDFKIKAHLVLDLGEIKILPPYWSSLNFTI